MTDEPRSATFVIPIKGDRTDAVLKTVDSVLRFRQHAYKEVENCQILCIGEIPDVDTLRGYATRHTFSPNLPGSGWRLNKYGVYPVSDWPERERWSLTTMPEIAAYLNTAAIVIYNSTVILMPAGKQIRPDAEGILLKAIQAVGANYKLHGSHLLVVSPDNDTASPASAVFSNTALMSYGIGTKALDGVPVVATKKLFGGIKFARVRHEVPQDVSWLMAAIGLHYQETNGLTVSFASWMSSDYTES